MIIVLLAGLLFLTGSSGAVANSNEKPDRAAGTVSTNTKDGAAMVWVPGATFTMGSIDGVGKNNQRPAHQVTLSGYWIYKYDVTVAQYRAFCAASGHALPPFSSGFSWAGKSGWNDAALQQHPIVNVTWKDANAYADWAGVSLPTEAQWEYASRGPAENNYPWGGTATAADPNNGWDQTKCANWYNSGSQNISTWPVGSFPAGASWCGAEDMAGNVWQWCADWYGDYSTTPVTNPTGPASGDYRVLRGGSWVNYYDNIEYSNRGAYRGDSNPYYYWYNSGFRCASLSPGP
jgi:formylglycine-generating enzyme required for sulfatase activity